MITRPEAPGCDESCSASGTGAAASRVRGLVLGFQDGLLVPLAVVTGLAGANVAKTAVLVGGVAEAAAGALAMGTGAFLASRAENPLYNREIADEEAEIARRPSVESMSWALLLDDEGLPASGAREVAHGIATSPLAFAKTKVEKELGLAYGSHHSETGDAVVVGLAHASAALIPLWPYFFWPIATALMVSLPATAIALFALGIVKARAARTSSLRSGLEVLFIGGGSAAVGYAIGWLGHALAG
jgi:VIT1/CCC1 family predicted Fe2+/Mn2+ transporter